MRNRDTKCTTVRTVGAGVSAKPDPVESGEKHIRGTEQSRVSCHEDNDRGEGASKMRKMRGVSSRSRLRRGSKFIRIIHLDVRLTKQMKQIFFFFFFFINL